MGKLRRYSDTLQDGQYLLIAAEGTDAKSLPGWVVLTRQGRGWQAVAVHAIKDGPQELGPECGGMARAGRPTA
jgi:hypothetical protein